MKRRIICLVLAFVMVLSFTYVPVFATTVDSGKCGDNLTWTLDSYGTLTIAGNGAMYDYNTGYASAFPPWMSYSSYGTDFIKKLSIGEQVTYIGTDAFAFLGIDNVVVPDSVTKVGQRAFQGSSLSSIKLSKVILSMKYQP